MLFQFFWIITIKRKSILLQRVYVTQFRYIIYWSFTTNYHIKHRWLWYGPSLKNFCM